MPGAWWTKIALLIAMIVIAAVSLIPTLYPIADVDEQAAADEEGDVDDSEVCLRGWPGWVCSIYEATSAKITLGLDLQGGLHLQYQVDVEKAISDKVDRFVEELQRELDEAHPDAGCVVTRIAGSPALRVTADSASPLDLIDENTLIVMNLELRPEDGTTVRLDVDSQFIEETKRYAIEQAIATIRARIDDVGVKEPSISRRGETDIIVQLPGLDEADFERMKTLIAQTAQLEFKMVSDANGTFFSTVQIPPDAEGIRTVAGRPQAETLEPLRELVASLTPPEGTNIAYLEVNRYVPETGALEHVGYQPILLEAQTHLTGEYVTDARTGTDPQTNRPVVNMTFDSEGADIFGRLTSANVGRQMAIVLDEVVKSAPTINEPILGGRCQISMGGGGTFQESMQEALALAIVLRNGALPAPIEKQFETQVGPSLGHDSIRAGQISLAVAFLLVFIFIVAYYKISGIIASTALVLNVLFILAALALLQATLTLPGIAGIILTIGMAVDANVIVFERIKEELRLGKTARASVAAGYEKAMSAVLDANITTGIAGLVLMEVGSGPVRGFAVTLLIGIICSLFTALVVTRLIFDYLIDRVKVARISI